MQALGDSRRPSPGIEALLPAAVGGGPLFSRRSRDADWALCQDDKEEQHQGGGAPWRGRVREVKKAG